NLDRFPLQQGRDHARPVILCTATLDESRKGGRVLMRAFNLLKAARPEAVLEVCSPTPEHRRQELGALVEPRWREGGDFPGPGRGGGGGPRGAGGGGGSRAGWRGGRGSGSPRRARSRSAWWSWNPWPPARRSWAPATARCPRS